MDTTQSTIKVGQKIPKEVIKLAKQQVREARKAPKVYDPDCPPSSPEALAEFAAMARELRKNRRPTIYRYLCLPRSTLPIETRIFLLPRP